MDIDASLTRLEKAVLKINESVFGCGIVTAAQEAIHDRLHRIEEAITTPSVPAIPDDKLAELSGRIAALETQVAGIIRELTAEPRRGRKSHRSDADTNESTDPTKPGDA